MAAETNLARWLDLASDLQRAGAEPVRWPQVFADLCLEMDCPDVFGDGQLPSATPTTPFNQIHIGQVALQARQCAVTCTGRCGQGPAADEGKRRACLAMLDHLDRGLAVGKPPSLSSPSAPAASVAIEQALDAIGRPLLVCTPDGRLIHANAAGQEELLRRRRMSLLDERLQVGSGQHRQAWTSRATDLGSWHIPLTSPERERADLWCRAITSGGVGGSGSSGGAVGTGDHLYLLTLTLDTAPAKGNADGSLLQALTPRQRELATLLVAGHTLTAAAGAMGITRRTGSTINVRCLP